MLEEWLALLPHSKKVLGSGHGAPCVEVYVFPISPHIYLKGAPAFPTIYRNIFQMSSFHDAKLNFLS